jgi:RNA polymerase sigma-70 factor (ECF subfamily)
MPQENAAWENLLNDQRPLLSRIVLRVARRFGTANVRELDDAIQEVCIKMSSVARQDKTGGQDDAALEAYLKALIANAAHDFFRKRYAKRRDTAATTPIDNATAVDLADSGASGLEAEILLTEIESLVEGDRRDRSVFCLYYQQGWTAKEIASLPSVGLSAKGVESVVFRITTALRKRIRSRKETDS